MEIGTALALVQFADQCIKYGQKLVRRCQSFHHAEAESRELIVSIEHNWMKTEAQITFLKRISKKLDPCYSEVQSRVLSELEGKLKTATHAMDQLLMHEKANKANKEKQGDPDIPAIAKALEKMDPRKKLRYAFKKEGLENIRDDLESWQRRFDPSWMLTMRIADSLIDEQLDQEEKKPQQTKFIMAAKGVRDVANETDSTPAPKASIFKPATILTPTESQILFSSAILCQLSTSGENVLVDTMVCNAIADRNRTTGDVSKLARILSNVDPSTFGLLVCEGVVKTSRSPSLESLSVETSPVDFPERERRDPLIFKFLFAIPKFLSSPKSLRALLIESNPFYPLNRRLDLAKQLTSSVLFIHSSKFVHKNIRPETAIVFEREGGSGKELGDLFLVGFEKFRPAEGMTYWVSDGIWQHDLCTFPHSYSLWSKSSYLSTHPFNNGNLHPTDRHPSRQGTQPEEEYQMQHDIYSLGVLLLELGLWKSFITYPDPSSPSDHTETPIPITPLFVKQHAGEKDVRKRASAIKTHLTSLAIEMLPAKMGQKYTDIVLLCLGCLDHTASAGGESEGGAVVGEFADVFDEDGIVVGVKYIEKILLKVQEISV